MLPTTIITATFQANYVGASGRCYTFKQLIQEKPFAGHIWMARSGAENFVLKDIPENIYDAFETSTRTHIKASPYLRLPIDSIPNERIYVYRFLTGDFMNVIKRKISLENRKQILKAALQGLTDLHAQDVVHLDIKPDNVLVDFHGNFNEALVGKVQLADLENAAYLPTGRCIMGMLPGNDDWRSPEDMFSFGIMCIYAIIGRVIFGVDADMRKYTEQGALPSMVRLQRQISYFGDRDGINGLLTHTGDDELSLKLLSNAYDSKDDDDHGYKHISTWPDIKDDVFKDLIISLMSLDPKRRFTAQQTLDHPWFKGVKLI